jgi:hypothetical protein
MVVLTCSCTERRCCEPATVPVTDAESGFQAFPVTVACGMLLRVGGPRKLQLTFR